MKFLIDTYGEQKFADLFRAFDDGATTAEALQQVYGFNQDGLENAWRDSVGLPPRAGADARRQRASARRRPATTTALAQNGDDGGARTSC